MDPDSNLKEQLELSKDIIALVEDQGVLSEEDVSDLEEKATRLAELVEALDGWINSRGFLPKRWRMDDHSE